ncbi:MAG: right-handed parallel beta-helix repeat-containing protein [Chloracidobacterium sp.]|nr:right-handed parallel beta-helix repeat-containing protein [Chloracidobacterium sp.]MDW8218598.1 right-handed parallel beta-helix repeat-containing protein [Acidobacteriota bacterium]
MAQPTPNPASLQPGLVIGGYRLEAPLAADIGDAAWRAQSLADHVIVRLDVFYATPATSPLTRTAFALAKLPPHPHVAPVLDVVSLGEQTFLVTPYVPSTLADLPCPLEPPEVVAYGQALLAALQFLHDHHVVHGALTPRSVGLEAGQVSVRGYGLMTERPRPAGALAYTSPWALENPPTPRDDLWAAGVILFELLSGDLPFPHHDPAELRLAIRTLCPDPLPGTVPARLRHIVAHALERHERRCYASAEAMREELAACADELTQDAARRSSGSWRSLPVEPVALPPHHTGRWALVGIALISLLMLSGVWLTIRHFEGKDQWRMTARETVVAPSGGDFSTITAAVNAARIDARILVRPGIYRETVTLTRNIEIVADGPPDSVVLESDAGPCLRQRLGSQVVRGLTLRSTEHPAVHLDGGALTLEDCRITAAQADGVMVSGHAARLTLRRSRVHSGGGHGLTATAGAQVELVECDIADQAGDGVRLDNQARLMARDSRFVGNRQTGVHALGNAAAWLDRCVLERNGRAMFGNVQVAPSVEPR